MKDCEQLQIISCGLKGNKGRYPWGTLPPAEHISYKPEMVGERFGWVTVVSPEKRWNRAKNHCYVLTRCSGCNYTQWQNLNNLKRGKSKGCQACSQKRKIPYWLDRRLTAARQRCENPNAPGYKNYGARGIRWRFPSVLLAGIWMMENFQDLSHNLEIDRIDNNKDYEPGNIRLVPRTINQNNKRTTVLTHWDQKYWPYARSVVIKKLSGGLNREGIITEAKKAVQEKKKNWRLIEARLEFMTYEMPDHIIVLPYLENSSTTVDMAAPLVP